jgi:hypothetical protein
MRPGGVSAPGFSYGVSIRAARRWHRVAYGSGSSRTSLARGPVDGTFLATCARRAPGSPRRCGHFDWLLLAEGRRALPGAPRAAASRHRARRGSLGPARAPPRGADGARRDPPRDRPRHLRERGAPRRSAHGGRRRGRAAAGTRRLRDPHGDRDGPLGRAPGGPRHRRPLHGPADPGEGGGDADRRRRPGPRRDPHARRRGASRGRAARAGGAARRSGPLPGRGPRRGQARSPGARGDPRGAVRDASGRPDGRLPRRGPGGNGLRLRRGGLRRRRDRRGAARRLERVPLEGRGRDGARRSDPLDPRSSAARRWAPAARGLAAFDARRRRRIAVGIDRLPAPGNR